MSEPRRNDADTREPARQPPGRATGDRPTSPGTGLGPLKAPPGSRPAPAGISPRWGQLPPGRGIVLVAGAAGLGTVLTVVTRSDPGFILGLLIVIGTVAACLAVRPRRAYLIIPAPALAYLAGAVVAGLVHDRAVDVSHTLLVINAARWFASGFIAIAAATLLAAVIAGVRWLRTGRDLGLPYPAAGRSQSAQSGTRPPRDRDPDGRAQRRLPG